ncbi:hypothetical protein T05_6468 [Trichinella murrelli]|uniref:Uncharacterized protein n=1 Tax=Trichinella murrelli TaxID=144512 RepID=A0A0V0T1U0_9BILA|nr:hypothetical protein T05_6468 [Trichinella murrelli]
MPCSSTGLAPVHVRKKSSSRMLKALEEHETRSERAWQQTRLISITAKIFHPLRYLSPYLI